MKRADLQNEFVYKTVCVPCNLSSKRRKCKCLRTKPCLSCVLYGTEDECYNSQNTTATSTSKSTTSCLKIPSLHQSRKHKTSGLSSTKPEATSSDNSLDFFYNALPPPDECYALCICYLDEIQWFVAFGDKHQFLDIYNKILSKEASALELACVFVMMAITGQVALEDTPVSVMSSIRDPRKHKSYIQQCIALLEVHDRQQTALQTALEVPIIKPQIQMLIAIYMHQARIPKSAYYVQQSHQSAKQAGLFDELNFLSIDNGLITPERIFASRFRLNLCFLLGWNMMIIGENITMEIEEEIKMCLSDIPYLKQHDAVEADWLRSKALGVYLGLKVSTILSKVSMSPEVVPLVMLLDSEILRYLYASTTFDTSMSTYSVDSLDSAKVHCKSISTKLFAMFMRCLLMKPFVYFEYDAAIRAKALQAAYDSVMTIPLCVSMLRSPWKGLEQTGCTVDFMDAAMSIFAAALESGPPTSSLLTSSGSLSGRTADFVAQFDAIYSYLNWMGYMGPATLKCAVMIKSVPVPRPLDEKVERRAVWLALPDKKRTQRKSVARKGTDIFELEKEISSSNWKSQFWTLSQRQEFHDSSSAITLLTSYLNSYWGDSKFSCTLEDTAATLGLPLPRS